MMNQLRVLLLACGAALIAAGCQEATIQGPPPDLESARDIRAALEAGGGSAGGDAGPAETFNGNFATIKGRFVVDGAPPVLSPVSINKDTGTCGTSIRPNSLLVNPGGGLKYVAVYARKVPEQWLHESARPDAAQDTKPVFDQIDCRFTPHLMGVQRAQTLVLKNSDPVGHNAKMDGPQQNLTFGPNSSLEFKHDDSYRDPYTVTCSIHDWMRGFILVREDGYFDISKEDGSFEIANVPAEVTLTFRVWHERGTRLRDVQVENETGGEAAEWKSGSFQVKLQPDEVRELKFVIPASDLSG